MGKNRRIIILTGGFSEEAEVSKTTSNEVASALESRKYEIKLIDPSNYKTYSEMIKAIREFNPFIVFNGLHGAEGEDGRIQSLLSLEKIPFTGSAYRASAISMDKYISGVLVKYIGISIPMRYLLYKDYVIDSDMIIKKIGFPMVVKPNDSGSSVGISIIAKADELKQATSKAFKYSDKVLLEQFIKGRELTVAILGEKALPVVEIKPKNGWYDYANKYTKGHTIYEVPAKLTEQESSKIQRQAQEIFKLFGCKAYARVDFRYDGKDFYFLEVNTLPGMTALSLTPMAAKETGLSFGELLEKIIEFSQTK
ncbi:MAG: D-alanine--D-alanine ligase [Candidatus Cloacimonetes bacterium]|nr:D-alanine--D-alanine ligase [Candidatus Cloacimonadota bacterium]